MLTSYNGPYLVLSLVPLGCLGLLESCWSQNLPIHKIAGHADVCSTALVWLIIVRCVSYLGNCLRFADGKGLIPNDAKIQISWFSELTSPLDSLLSVSITYNISIKKSSAFVYFLRFSQKISRQKSNSHKGTPITAPAPAGCGPARPPPTGKPAGPPGCPSRAPPPG